MDVRQVTRRLIRCGTLAVLVALPAVALPVTDVSIRGLSIVGTATARAAGPDAVTLSGPGIEDGLRYSADDSSDQFADLVVEVSWLATRPGVGHTPEPSQLGAKYVLTLFSGEQPIQRYELYPQAAGGPRVFRPARWPDGRRTTAAWFYGRLTMPDTLIEAGAPVSGAISGLGGAGASGGGAGNGGVGGGAVADQPLDPNADLISMLSRWRRVLLLNGAVVVLIAAGLAGVALLIHRRTDLRYRRLAALQAARSAGRPTGASGRPAGTPPGRAVGPR